MLYGHGDNGYLHRQGLLADFSSNVWYGGEPAGLKDHLFQRWQLINRYPEVLAESLTERVSRHHGLNPQNILVNNGTTESIYLIAQLFKRKKTSIVFPSFSEYEDACRMHEHSLHFLSWTELENWIAHLTTGLDATGIRATGLRATGLRAVEPAATGLQSHSEAPTAPAAKAAPDRPTWLNTDLLWVGNPNNPTGAVLPALETLIRHYPEIIFIVDEAFIEFTQSIASLVGLVRELPNLVILRSLTKVFAIPGLRLGYVVAEEEMITRLRAFKLPWSVNALALEAGNFIFDHYSRIRLPLASLLQDKEHFIRQLEGIGIKIQSSHTHFFLCDTGREDAAELQNFLLDKFRLLIRNAANFRGLGAGNFRLATLSPDKNQWLINALKEWKEKK
jgi:threonine-phosphate decarboxylase